MHTNRDYTILHKQDPTLPKIDLLLLFMKGDPRIPDAFGWSVSIRTKMSIASILFNDVLEQIPKGIKEFEEVNRSGYIEGIELLKLAMKYENYLNSIYSLCENISRIVHFLYGERNLPDSFFDQKSRFLKEPDINPDYTEILEKTNWYDEVHSIRREATHFLSGFVGISDDTKLGYFNKPKSKRKGTPERISIDDIEEHLRGIHNGLSRFLYAFGDAFIKIINQDSRVSIPCIYSRGLIGTYHISLREYLNNGLGICGAPKFDCPVKDSCKRRS